MEVPKNVILRAQSRDLSKWPVPMLPRLYKVSVSQFRPLSEDGGPCGVGGWAPMTAEFRGAVPIWDTLVFAHLSFLLLPLQAGTRCGAESQIGDESCQKISPLQRKQRKTTSWWGFLGEGKVKSSLLPSMHCLKMAVSQRENIPPPTSRAVCGVKGRACVPSTRVQIGPRRGYQDCFHRSFEWAERGLERRKK